MGKGISYQSKGIQYQNFLMNWRIKYHDVLMDFRIRYKSVFFSKRRILISKRFDRLLGFGFRAFWWQIYYMVLIFRNFRYQNILIAKGHGIRGFLGRRVKYQSVFKRERIKH